MNLSKPLKILLAGAGVAVLVAGSGVILNAVDTGPSPAVARALADIAECEAQTGRPQPEARAKVAAAASGWGRDWYHVPARSFTYDLPCDPATFHDEPNYFGGLPKYPSQRPYSCRRLDDEQKKCAFVALTARAFSRLPARGGYDFLAKDKEIEEMQIG